MNVVQHQRAGPAGVRLAGLAVRLPTETARELLGSETVHADRAKLQ